jgi:hypothetical protein
VGDSEKTASLSDRRFEAGTQETAFLSTTRVEGRTQVREAVMWVPPLIILDDNETVSCVPASTLLEERDAVS